MSLRCPCLYHLLATFCPIHCLLQLQRGIFISQFLTYPYLPLFHSFAHFAAVSECLLIFNVLTFTVSPLKGGKGGTKTARDEPQATEEFCGGAAVSWPQGGVNIFDLPLLPESLWNKDRGTWRAPQSGEVARPPCSFWHRQCLLNVFWPRFVFLPGCNI